MARGEKKKKQGESRAWNRTGIGSKIKMQTEIIEGQVCVRLATMKSNSCRVSLFMNYGEKEFFTVITTVTGSVFVETLPDQDHAQLVYNRLPRRVLPSQLEKMGIVNPRESDIGDLEESLAEVFGTAV
jgi:hypothetical protein